MTDTDASTTEMSPHLLPAWEGQQLYAYWFARKVNFGDLITPFLLRQWTGRQPINLLPESRSLNPLRHNRLDKAGRVALAQRLGITRQAEYAMVGSILGWKTWKDDVQIVWGSGFLRPEATLAHRPRHIYAVRGERSLAKLPREWAAEVEALGDPGILLGDYFDTPVPEPGRIGLVAHYSDKGAPILQEACEASDIKVIDVQQDVAAFVADISTCEVIVASAMHAIIAADAMGLPNRWIQLSSALPPGGEFKFGDYFSVAGQPQDMPQGVESLRDVRSAARQAIQRDLTGAKAALRQSMPLR
jgi:pyruvyltransferase